MEMVVLDDDVITLLQPDVLKDCLLVFIYFVFACSHTGAPDCLAYKYIRIMCEHGVYLKKWKRKIKKIKMLCC